MNSSRNRSSIIYILLFIAIIAMVVINFQQQATSQEVLPLNKVADDIKNGLIQRILVEDDNQLRVIYYKDGIERTSHKEPETTLIEQLKDFGVSADQLSSSKLKIEIKPPSAWVGVISMLGYAAPFIILAIVFWFVFRQAQGSNNAAMSFGKSRARMFTGDRKSVV